MPIPKVAIVGRPNVGKSSIFNWLAGRTIAIVEPTAGVTRDRLDTLGSWNDRYFELTDTGGMGIVDVDNLTEDVEKQIDIGLREADVMLFVVDARDGVVALDEHVAARLRPFNKPILVVANKADVPSLDVSAQDAYRLGFPDLLCVSAQQLRNKPELLDWITEHLPPPDDESAPPASDLKLAIVGRRNTGKSTFINSLAQSDRVIVSEVAGTTRDSVDVRIERDGKVILAIDTAGVRKKSSIANSIDFYSIARAERSIRRADVVLLFFDPTQTVSRVDKLIADYVMQNHKPAIFVVNKWDLMKPMPTGEWGEYLRKMFPSLDYVPMAFITAKDGKNVFRVLNLAQHLHKQASTRVSTSRLNRTLREAIAQQAPPGRQNRSPRIFFGTQVSANPPTIVLFTNGPELFDKPYLRYLLKWFRDQLPFAEVPIHLYLRMKGQGDGPANEEDAEEPPRAKARKPAEPRGKVRKPAPPRAEKVKSAAATPKRAKRPSKKPELWRDV
jgi:GTP-binding protein